MSSRSAGRSTKFSVLLKPGGVFVITSPLNFRIHGYPDDYWRMTPSCLRRMLEPYEARVTPAIRDIRRSPHTVMGIGSKDSGPQGWCRTAREAGRSLCRIVPTPERELPTGEKLRRLVSQFYRSKGERRQVADYYAAEFQIDLPSSSRPSRDRESPIHTQRDEPRFPGEAPPRRGG